MLSPAALASLDRRGYTPEMVAAEELAEYDRGEFFIGVSTFWLPDPAIVFPCKSASGKLFAFHTCALDRKEYRLRRDPMLPWIPSCYGSSDDYEIMFTTRTVVLCEGIFDRTALKRCLPDHAVLARLTKGLSANLMVMLERFCSKVILAFDMDEPGVRRPRSQPGDLRRSDYRHMCCLILHMILPICISSGALSLLRMFFPRP